MRYRISLLNTFIIISILLIKIIYINLRFQIPFHEDILFTIGMILLIFFLPLIQVIMYNFLKYKYTRSYFLDRYNLNYGSSLFGILFIAVACAFVFIYQAYQMIFIMTLAIGTMICSLSVISELKKEFENQIRQENIDSHLDKIKKFRIEEDAYERKISH